MHPLVDTVIGRGRSATSCFMGAAMVDLYRMLTLIKMVGKDGMPFL